MLKQIAVLALVLPLAASAWAASDDAWAEFATEVEQACLKATSSYLPDGGTAIVDPFGSENYGLAIVTGEAYGTTSSLICVFDKQTKAVEIGGELAVTVTPVEKP